MVALFVVLVVVQNTIQLKFVHKIIYTSILCSKPPLSSAPQKSASFVNI